MGRALRNMEKEHPTKSQGAPNEYPYCSISRAKNQV